MPSPLVECVPNFSEGRDAATLEALRTALTTVPGVRLLDVQADTSHNRSVFTFVGPPDAAVEAALSAMRVATERIDLTKHRGEHPRMGATDVVPFIPVRDVTMDQCVALARRFGERAAAELLIPIYLYARAAVRPERERLPDIRKGEFEGLRERIGTDPAADPDFGPRGIHPTAGAGGARALAGGLEAWAGGPPARGGGGAAGLAGARAGGLVAMVARLTVGRKAYAAVERRAAEVLTTADTLRAELRRLVDDDAAAYAKVSAAYRIPKDDRSEEHTSELQSQSNLVCRLLLEKKKTST